MGNVSLSPTVPSTGAGISTLNPIPEVPKGDVDLVAPLGTVDPGEAGIRVSGNINIAALHVVNAANIQVQGESKGIPATATVNTGALTSASSAASSATQSAQEMTRQQASARQNLPSIISVQILGYGNEPASGATGEGAAPAGQPPRRDGSASGDPRSVFQMLGNGDIPEAQRQGSRTPNGAGCRRLKRAPFLSRGSHTPLLHCLFTDRHRVPGSARRTRHEALARRRVALVSGQQAHRVRAAWGMSLAFEGTRGGVRWRPVAGALRALAAEAPPEPRPIFAFDIPAQPLQAALEQYSNVTGGSVVYRAALTVGRSAAVKESIRRRLPCAC